MQSKYYWSLLLIVIWASSIQAKTDLTNFDLEELMDMEVVSVSRVAQRASKAPSAVTVLRGEDFRIYGWRTLAEALNSVRGYLTTNGGEYTYVAIRGFSAPGDYNTRLLLMINGIRTNGNIYDQAFLGHEFPLDPGIIDRIEIVRGPGSMVYGGNAFFGVVNVITKNGKQLDGLEAIASVGSFNTQRARLSYGRELANGGDFLFSFSGVKSNGQAMYFPELGQADLGTENTVARRLYASYRQGPWQFTAIAGSREHGRPNGSYSSVFNDPRNRDWDELLLLDARYQTDLSASVALSTRIFHGQSKWRGQYVNDYNGMPFDVDYEQAQGSWWGIDSQVNYSGFTGHHLLLGLDYQNNLQQDQFAADLPPSLRCTATNSATTPCLDDQRNSDRLGIYVQDDLSLSEQVSLHLGMRYDRSTNNDNQWSPRLGLIWQINREDVVKLLYGRAFRPPNVYERYYNYPGVGAAIANLNLQPETIKTLELVWERYLSENLHLTVSAYLNQVDHWMVQTDTEAGQQYQNQPRIHSRGLDLELEKNFANAAYLRASYTGQFVPDGITSQHLFKVNWATPLPYTHWYLGLEGQAASKQETISGDAGGYALFNANLRWQPSGDDHTELTLGVYNLFDKRYAHSYPYDDLYSGIPRESLTQEGRTWQFRVSHRFP